jgi:hypothetical protein
MSISEKTLDLIVAAASLLLVITAIGVLMTWGLNTVIGGGSEEQEQKLTRGPSGEWVVPESRQPKDLDQLESAPAITLLPGRLENPPPAKESAERPALARTVGAFLPRWESFEPQKVLAAAEFGRRNPYEQKLLPWSVNRGRQDLVQRTDVSDWPQVCPTCSRRQSWVSGGQIAESLRINQVSGDRAHVSISGIVSVEDGDGQPVLVARNYGLLLEKEAGKWLVLRASADRGQRLS